MPRSARSTLKVMGALLGFVILLAVALVAAVAILSGIVAREAVHPPRHAAGYAVAHGLAVDPSDLGLDFDEWTLTVQGETVLPVWDVKGHQPSAISVQPEKERESRTVKHQPSRLTAVFVHGWGHSRIDMLRLIKPWQDWCARLVLYDLRGHGDAPAGRSWLGHHEDLDLLALLDRLGDSPVVLIGQSMGAVIALAAAASNEPVAERIAGIVAYGPYRDFHTSLRSRLRAGGYPTRPLTDLAMLWLRLRGIRPKGARDEDLARVRCPILVVCGADDAVVPISDGRRIAEVLSQATMLTIPNAGHRDAPTADPQRHDDALREFVERVQGSVN